MTNAHKRDRQLTIGRHLPGNDRLAAVGGAAGIQSTGKGTLSEQAHVAGESNLLPDPLNPRDPCNPGGPFVPGDTWHTPPWSRWTYQHISEMRLTAQIWRGPGPAYPLLESPRPLGDIVVKFDDGARSVDDYLARSFTDGFLVLHRGRIVFERYLNGFRPHKQHLLMSTTKSFIGILVGILVDKGLLDLQKLVTHYLPELEVTAYKGATVQHLLDMASGVVYDDDYDPFWKDSVLSQPRGPRTMWELALSLKEAERPHGALFKYKSMDTDVVGFILQRVSGMYLADLISQELWVPMGAEQDAYITVDKSGFGLAEGGLCVTLRDLGRFALLVLDQGARGRHQIIPPAWIDELWKGRGAPLESALRRGTIRSYHNFWWIDRDNRALWTSGWGGQISYVEPDAEFAAVKLSHWPGDNGEQYQFDLRTAVLAIRSAVSGS